VLGNVKKVQGTKRVAVLLFVRAENFRSHLDDQGGTVRVVSGNYVMRFVLSLISC
jgi:hypothetical protein